MPSGLQVIDFTKLRSLNNVNSHYLRELNSHSFSVQSVLIEYLLIQFIIIIKKLYNKQDHVDKNDDFLIDKNNRK